MYDILWRAIHEETTVHIIMKKQTFTRPPNGDVDQGWAILSVCWAFVAAALGSTILRVWIRTRLTRNLGWDDGIMVIAMVSIDPASIKTGARLDLTPRPGYDHCGSLFYYRRSLEWTGET